MPDVEIDVMPPLKRPIRVPESVPLRHAEPRVAIAGRKGTWRLPFRLRANVAPNATLRLQVFGGRNNRGAFGDCQTENPSGDGYVAACGPDGVPLVASLGDRAGAYLVKVPGTGLRAGDTLTVVLGDRSGGGNGATAPKASLLNKFFVLHWPQLDSESVLKPRLPDWAIGTACSVDWRAAPVWTEVNERQILAVCTMHVLGGQTHHIRAYVPSQVHAGDPFAVLVRPEDEHGNLSCRKVRDVRVFLDGKRLECAFEEVPGSTCARLRTSIAAAGVHRLVVSEVPAGCESATNPVICAPASGRFSRWAKVVSSLMRRPTSLNNVLPPASIPPKSSPTRRATHGRIWST